MPDGEIDTLIHEAVVAARDGDASTFVDRAQGLQNQDWNHSNAKITDALARSLAMLPETTPNSAAALTARISERYSGDVDIARTIMEVVIRDAAGEHRAAEDVPPSISGVYSLLAIGQVVYEGHLSIYEAICSSTPTS